MPNSQPEAIIIGGSVVDIPVRPLDSEVFSASSTPVDRIIMNTGGDALNEAVALAHFGRRVRLISKVGCDAPGDYILNTLQRAGVDTKHVIRQENLDTSINIVMIRSNGERSFITSRNSSLRKLSLQDILPALDAANMAGVKLVNLASMFVSHALSISDTAELFRNIKARGMILCADTTTAKNHETPEDLKCALQYLDYYFPNKSEAEIITGKTDLNEIADVFLSCGVKHVVIKIGSEGCFLKSANLQAIVPAWPRTHCIDTTGAGDNFAAAFIDALLDGKNPIECARYANAAASICVEHLGATYDAQNKAMVNERYYEMRRSAEN